MRFTKFILGALMSLVGTLAFAARSELPIATPESQGVDSRQLTALCDHLNDSKLDVRSLLILRNGNLIFERYEQRLTPNHNFAVFSVTKSVTSTLVGIAIDRKLIESVDTPIAPFFGHVRVAKPDERRARITIKDLLTMSSGIAWTDTARTALDPGTNFTEMVGTADRVTYVLNRPMAAEPGATFNYSNGDAQLTAAIIARAAKAPVPTFGRAALFDKLGFRGWEWVWPDKTGLHPGGYGLRLRARDMAKFGQLFLQDGKWNDQQIVSPGWVRAATTDQTQHAFGYMWWTNIKPAGRATFTAIGWHGQFICVIPDLKMVVVMTANIDSGTMSQTFAKLLEDFVLPAVKSDAAIDENKSAVRALDDSFRRAFEVQRRSATTLSEDDTPRISGR